MNPGRLLYQDKGYLLQHLHPAAALSWLGVQVVLALLWQHPLFLLSLLLLSAVTMVSIDALAGYETIRSEVKYGSENSRIDLLLEAKGRPSCFVEIKSVTLGEGAVGYFPDAVTERGRKHLRELISMVEQRQRAVLLDRKSVV